MTLTVFDHGAVGDGVADDTAAFQLAANTGWLHAPAVRATGEPAVYKISDTITLQNTQVTLDGQVDATSIPAATVLYGTAAFRATGQLHADISVPTRLYSGSRTVPVGGVSESGGLALVHSAERPVLGMTRTDRHRGELVRVKRSDSSNFTLSTGLYFDYSAGLAKVAPITPLTGVKITGGGTITCGGVGSGHSGIIVEYAIRPVVSGIKIIGAEDLGVAFEYCWAPQATGPHVEDSTSSESLGNTGYGVLFGSAVRGGLLTNAVLYNCRHGVAGGGRYPAIFCTVDRTFADDAMIECHEPTFEWQFFGNTNTGGREGILVRGQNALTAFSRVFDKSGSGIRIKTWDGVNTQRGTKSVHDRVLAAKIGIEANGEAAALEPVSTKQGLSILGAFVEQSGSSTTSAVEVSRATEATVEAFTQFNRGAHGATLADTRAERVDVYADDVAEPVVQTKA